MLTLTSDNYYSEEADNEYMSCSQFQEFCGCEAAALAKLQGRYVPPKSEALIVGNYFHTALESDEAHERFCNEHYFDVYKTKQMKTGEVIQTGKYAPYLQADEMILAAYSDPLVSKFLLMEGENEKIMTGELFGVPWKIRLDKYIPDKRIIIDWKTSANIRELRYNYETGEKETFVEYFGYMMRAAVYSEIEKQFTGQAEDPTFLIFAFSKQTPPDKEALLLNHRTRYDWELEKVRKKLDRIISVKTGLVAPERCGNCEYCRRTKSLKKIIPYYFLNPLYCNEGRDIDDITVMEDTQAC